MEPLELALSLADRAGEIMRKHFVLGIPTDVKADGSPLTVADTTINQLVIDEINRSFPDHSILAEEQSDMRMQGRFVWVCDPLDGTIPYSHGCPTSVFSLALCEEGVPQLGLLYDPFMGRLLVAERGKYAMLNGQRIAKLTPRKLENQLISIGSVHTYRDLLGELSRLPVTNIFVGSICYSGLLLALDQLAAIIFPHTSPWDGAALQVIIEEVHGKMTDLHGKSQRFDQNINGFVAGNPAAHAQLLEVLQRIHFVESFRTRLDKTGSP